MSTLLKISLVAWLWLLTAVAAVAQSSSAMMSSLLSRQDVQVELGLSEEMRKAIASHTSGLAESRESQSRERLRRRIASCGRS